MENLRFSTWLAILAICIASGGTSVRGQDDPPPTEEDAPSKATQQNLAEGQSHLADRFYRLEQIAARLAELTSADEPYRADLLRQALAQSRDREIGRRFGTIVELLEKDRLSVAASNQQALEQELQALLELLLKENRSESLRQQQDWARAQLKQVNQIIRLQRGVKARTEGGDELEGLAEDQSQIKDRTDQLADENSTETDEGGAERSSKSSSGQDESESGTEGESSSSEEENKDGEASEDSANREANESGESDEEGQVTETEETKDGSSSEETDSSQDPKNREAENSDSAEQSGKPAQESQNSESQQSPPQSSNGQQQQGESGDSAESPPPASPEENLRQRLREAQQAMEEAQLKLEQAQREGAAEDQEQALRELEAAKADLERILRQLREEEMERALVMLEARFRKMLEMQLEVYEGTLRLDKVSQSDRDHDHEIMVGRLRSDEEKILREANKALEILLEEGTSVAFPEAVMQMQEDMQSVTRRLAQLDIGPTTQMLEEDIIEQLEDSLSALQQLLEELEKKKTPPGQAPPPGEPTDPPLVDQLEEIKMIRALQMRVNRRTQYFSGMLTEDSTDVEEIATNLRLLADRQERIYQATRDLHLGRNQ